VRWVLMVVLLLVGCAKRASDDMSYEASYDYDGYEPSYGGMEVAAERAPAAPSRQARPRPSAAPSAMGGAPPPPVADAAISTPSEPATQMASANRMIHYNGFARVRVTRVDELLDQVAALAERLGGRVELLRGNQVSVRVPVDRFEAAFDEVLALGDVLARSVRADDVTEQFTAVDLRVKTLRATRDRLVDLLAKATEENEKLRLLNEITRVTEQLDNFERQRRTLADLADFARITVEGVPREVAAGVRGPDQQGFTWIRSLSPFSRAVFDDDKRIALVAPDGLVALSKRGPYLAESADGVVLWTLRVPNDPEGGGAFWVAAIEDRIAETFGVVTRIEAGRFTCLVLLEPGADEPYQWRICVQDVGRHLHVAQAWFPSPATVERYESDVMAAIAGGSQ
jgi:hypothetical protein